mgnify:CR=1 FL=1|nr:MAG TPA: hypothetical protein [Caudoviricetes sp.]
MSVESKINNLISAANTKTGKTDSDLTNAMQSLVDGYGGGAAGGGAAWELVASETATENLNSMRVTFDACIAVFVELVWGGVEDDLGNIGIYPNQGDTPYTGEKRAAAAVVTSSTTKKRGILCVRMDCRVGSYWFASAEECFRGDGSFGEIDADNLSGIEIGVTASPQYSVVGKFYMTPRNREPSSGIDSITAYGAGMAIGTRLKIWGIKK